MNYGGDYNQGGGGGGGFYAGSQTGTQATPGGSESRRNRSSETLRPVTIKQILEARQDVGDGPFMIDSVELGLLTFVGRVQGVTEQATNITYVIDDGTGTLDVKQWIDADSPSDESAQNLNEKYVRVVGQLKSFSSKRHVGAHRIREVADYNEVQYHFLETVATHLRLTRGPPEQFTGGAGGVKQQDTEMGGMGNTSSLSRLPPGLSENAKKLYLQIKDVTENEGIHLNIIKMKSGVPDHLAGDAITELLDLGVIFTTMDEWHFAPMDSL
ncbi:replication factor A2 [Pyronema omphalodes]|nr:replication factor A2 [Pyronema omphalodes]